MSKELLEMLALQGEIKVALMKAGIQQGVAHELAAELFDIIASSPVISEAHRAAYKALSFGEPEG